MFGSKVSKADKSDIEIEINMVKNADKKDKPVAAAATKKRDSKQTIISTNVIQQHFADAPKYFFDMYKQGKYVDATLELELGGKHRVHKVVLGKYSVYLDALFQSKQQAVYLVPFQDTEQMFPVLLEFLYSGGQNQVITSENVISLKVFTNDYYYLLQNIVVCQFFPSCRAFCCD